MTSPQKFQRTGQLLSEGITQNPINYASCSQVTPGFHLPDSVIAPAPLCAYERGMSFLLFAFMS